ncbi:molybdenum cofactor guanylyltransferase [Brevibacillus sp. B_LB10_24]
MTEITLGAAIMAGGQSRRMGTAKEWLDWGGRPLLFQLFEGLRTAGLPCLVAAGEGSGERWRRLQEQGIEVIRDEGGSHGPVSGICSALKSARKDALLILSCDLPFADSRQIMHLAALKQELNEWDALIPEAGGRIHPLFALYHARTLPVWEEALAARQYRIMSVLEKLRVKRIAEGYLDQWATFNMNTPDDYRRALAERRRRDALSPGDSNC